MSEFGFDELEDINLDEFIESLPDKTNEKEPEKINCPYCNKTFEIKEEYKL